MLLNPSLLIKNKKEFLKNLILLFIKDVNMCITQEI
jgi:hypothetical protein